MKVPSCGLPPTPVPDFVRDASPPSGPRRAGRRWHGSRRCAADAAQARRYPTRSWPGGQAVQWHWYRSEPASPLISASSRPHRHRSGVHRTRASRRPPRAASRAACDRTDRRRRPGSPARRKCDLRSCPAQATPTRIDVTSQSRRTPDELRDSAPSRTRPASHPLRRRPGEHSHHLRALRRLARSESTNVSNVSTTSGCRSKGARPRSHSETRPEISA